MSDYIDTREGWRRMLTWETADGRDMLQYEPNGDPEKAELWVRETPVPPLPTAPYTVIRVTKWSGGGRAVADLMLRSDGTWYDDTIGRTITNPETITSFEVLSEPRSVTAWAILNRVSDMPSVKGALTAGDFRKVADEFGVES